MDEERKHDFIIIDDDAVNNMICSRIIQFTLPGADIRTFTRAEKGLEHIRKNDILGNHNTTLLFLDINMPSLTGWDVLEELAGLPPQVKEKLRIYILSSSVDFNDREQAEHNALVLGYITKPLSRAKLLELFAPAQL